MNSQIVFAGHYSSLINLIHEKNNKHMPIIYKAIKYFSGILNIINLKMGIRPYQALSYHSSTVLSRQFADEYDLKSNWCVNNIINEILIYFDVDDYELRFYIKYYPRYKACEDRSEIIITH